MSSPRCHLPLPHLSVQITADGRYKHVGVEGCRCGGFRVQGAEAGEVRGLALPLPGPPRALQERCRGGADGGGALLQHPPPVVEGHEEDDGKKKDGGDEAAQDHGQHLRLPLLVFHLRLRQLLDGLQLGQQRDVDGVAGPELVPDLDLHRVGCSCRESLIIDHLMILIVLNRIVIFNLSW